MKAKIKITDENNSISLTISNFEVERAELVKERLMEIEVILGEILQFDEEISQLPQAKFLTLQSALAAMDLKYQAVLHAAKLNACAAKNVANGTESISDHGFPEFEGE